MPLLWRKSIIHSHCALILIKLSLQGVTCLLKTNYQTRDFSKRTDIFGPNMYVFGVGSGGERGSSEVGSTMEVVSWDVNLLNLRIN